MAAKSKKAGVKYGLRTQNAEIQPNQWTGTPQQEKFLAFYLTPKSPTFGNPYTSALEAGYSDSYAKIIAAPSVNRGWIAEARNLIKLEPEHIVQALQSEALDYKNNRGSDRIRALELIGKMQGLFVERHQNVNINIEQALEDLK